MSSVQPLKKIDPKFSCTICGGKNLSVIKDDDTNPKLKCNKCMFIFSGQDALDAEKAGAIKPSSKESLEGASDPEVKVDEPKQHDIPTAQNFRDAGGNTSSIPRTVKYVLIAKDRSRAEFCNQKTLKKTVLNWETHERAFELYELAEKKTSVKIEVE